MAAWSVYAPNSSRPKGLLHQCRALGNHLMVPTGAVLLFKQNDFTVFGNTCFPARFVEQHQGQQPLGLRIGKQLEK